MKKTVPHLIFNSIKTYPKNTVLQVPRNGQLISYTYSEYGEAIKNIFHALAASGLKKGDKLAILSNNMPEWTISDIASFCLGVIVVPIYQTLPANQISYILKDSDTRAIFVQNDIQLEKILTIKKELPKLEMIFSFEKIEDKEAPETFYELLQKGKVHREANPNLFNESLESIEPKTVCSLVYTSGTTGEPKGVMLNHNGFVTDIINAEAVLNLRADDIFLSFLPLSHLYERLAGHWCPMYKGGCIYYARGIDTVIEDIGNARPTVMVSVPRLYEKVANAVQEQIEESSPLKQKIFYWAIGTGLEYHENRIAGTLDRWMERRYKLAEKLVFKKIKTKLGGRFRYPIAGGAPLSVETLKFFEAIGLRIIEGYGMTETHLILTLTPAGKTKYGSCGKPIEGVEMRIDEDGEVLVKGEILMDGYFNKPELTADIFDDDGWLHTGDIGYLDEDKYLFLTDRKKNIIVTAGGKNVAPAPIEHKLKTSKYIDDICLVGNKRKFISALIMPNEEIMQKWADENNVTDLKTDKRVAELFQSEIDELQKDFAQYEIVKKFVILKEPLTVEKGELTPSLKIKRNVVENNYKKEIDALYKI